MQSMHGIWQYIFEPKNIKKYSSETDSKLSPNLQIELQTDIIFFNFYRN